RVIFRSDSFLLSPGRDDQISYLRRKESAQLTHPLDFAHLIGDALLKLLVQPVEIAEQPCVLYGDDGLGGEILHKFDLLVGKRADLLTINGDHTNQLVIFQHRHAKYRSNFTEFK